MTSTDALRFRQVALLLIAVGLAFVLWQIADVILLGFAGALFALFLVKVTHLVRRVLPLPYSLTLMMVVIVLILCLALLGLSFAPAVEEQITLFTEAMPAATEGARALLSRLSGILPVGGLGLEGITQGAGRVLGVASSAAGLFFSAITSTAIVLLVGFFIALQPSAYRVNVVRLVPKSMRKRADVVVSDITSKLWYWLLARFVSMLAVGLLTTIGLFILGMPVAPALGAVAGLLSFIPNFGPLLSLVPALFLALGQDPSMLYLIPIVYIVVQIIESNFITPFVEQYAVDVPAGLVILAQTACTVLFGVLGLLLATPILLVFLVILRAYYGDKRALVEEQ